MLQKALVALWAALLFMLPSAANAAPVDPAVVTWNIDSVEAGNNTDAHARAAMTFVAALTPLPVLGVPVESRTLRGVDSLLSIVQMPAGVPVATFAIGQSGAVNAALFAAGILALADPAIAAALDDWRRAQTDTVADRPDSR